MDVVLTPRHAVKPDELARLRDARASVVASDDRAIPQILESGAVALDALAGIGVRGALREPLASLARQLNAARPRLQVVALDLPSGIDADTGDTPGEVVSADFTVTLGGVKQGLLRFPAAAHVGRLIPRDIGIPIDADRDLPYTVIDPAEVGKLVPPRPLDAHKYRFGRVLVIAGSDHYLGAAVLCSGGAARVGAGLITVASTADVRRNVAAHLPEVTFTESDVGTYLGPQAVQGLEPYLRSHSASVIGPGLGRNDNVSAFVAQVLRVRPAEQRMVIDADALTALAQIEHWDALIDTNVALTPHSGELERLVGHALSQGEPAWSHAGQLARQWGCVLVSKGPFTCVAGPDGRVAVWPRANPALATGGTGDVLAGVSAGLLAQGLPTWDAARLAVAVHALAAERLIASRSWRTLLASDLFEELPAVLADLARSTRPQ